ncbi:DNA-binding SARP family transcriptional activator [Allocatelliglobosispora scoriae]|uniref:DNA-binding SARP family transcriptional activator n=1 Tax=Allocatelliglobosispora scoriae TaxID=643052 RepID=A0A841BV93_9ACTN|nr:BTAD domain-containing putative transcriptional regulator [Allocatelliglobosispora scoriae]MBB5872114.1 DNA-binding SARP family transcriptional activator [Allocatelliglobosispora scoriae]
MKPRQLLATLLLQPGRPVSVDRLIEVLWPDEPPRSAAANVQTYVSGLRGVLATEALARGVTERSEGAPQGAPKNRALARGVTERSEGVPQGAPEGYLVRRPPGYACLLGDATLDLADFLARADEASRLRRLGHAADALAAVESALALWRGQPLADLPVSPLWRVELDRVAERRLAATEEWLELRMQLGDQAGVVAELRGLTSEHPLREGLWALLIRALAELDRRADALATYAECRRTFAEELGVEPGPELRRLHMNLLAEPVSGGSSSPRLDASAAIVLRGFAVFGEESAPAWAAGALLGRPSADEVIDSLVDARLMVDAGQDRLGQRRLRVPLLVRLVTQETPVDQAGLVRLLGGYLSLAERAAHALPSSLFGPGVVVAPRWTVPHPPPAVSADPGEWFAVEHPVLLAAVEAAARADRADLAWELAFTLVPWCGMALRPDVWAASHLAAQEACRRLGDSLGTAVTLRGLGQLHLYHDEYQQAEAAFGRARLIFAQLGQAAGVAAALAGLGTVHRIRGEHQQALDYYDRALRSYRESGQRWGEAYALGAIGQVWLAKNDPDEAGSWLGRALELATAIDDRHRVAHLTHQLGVVSVQQGRAGEAEARFSAALDVFVAIGDLHGEAYALVELASLAGGDERLIRALDIYQRLGDRSAEARTVSRLSDLYLASGRPDLAEAYRDEARRLANLLH